MDLNRISKPTAKNKTRPGSNYILNLLKKDIKFRSGKFSDKNKESFFSQMSMLFSAGIDLQTILELSFQSYTKDKKLGLVYEIILNKIRNGDSLAIAMSATKQFNDFDYQSIQIGENTGKLASTFQKLTNYYQKKNIQRRKISAALSYPIIILITTFGAIFFMLKFVVPMFANTLMRFGGELPFLTKIVVSISNKLSYGVIIISILVLLFGIWYRNENNRISFNKRISYSIIKLPYLGKLVYKIHLLQFVQAMDLLLSAEITIVESIQLTQRMVQFHPLKAALETIRIDLLAGNSFHYSIQRHTFFDNTFSVLVKIGEEINQLDKTFSQLTQQYESDIDQQSNLLITLLEPLMILILAGVVGVILVAMYLPMFKIGAIVK